MKRIVRLLIAATALMGAVVASAGNANAVSNTPDFNSYIAGPNCDNGSHFSFNVRNWPSSYGSGDYNGWILYDNKVVGEHCDTSIKYEWATVDPNADNQDHFRWFYGQQSGDGSVAGKICYVWAFIPSAFATLHQARYDVWGNPNGSVIWAQHAHWLFWPGHNVDQYNLTGWIYLGHQSMGSDSTVEVSLTNYDPTGTGAAGAGSVAFHCY